MIEEKAQQFRQTFDAIKTEIQKRIVGLDNVVDTVISALFLGGHVLLEGVPGLGKTLLVKSLAESLDLTFSRIQFTPDLMPADILGTNIIEETGTGQKAFRFQKVRSSRTCCSRMKSTALHPKRNRLFWKRCRNGA